MSQSLRHPRVLVAEDDHAFRQLIAAMLRREGYVVQEAATGLDMLERLTDSELKRRTFDLIVSDVRMPGLTGIEVIDGLKLADGGRPWTTPVIFMTAFGDRDLQREASRLGATILDKPFDLADLVLYAQLFAPPHDGPRAFDGRGDSG